MKKMTISLVLAGTAAVIILASTKPAIAGFSLRAGLGARLVQAGSGVTAHIGNTGLLTFDLSFGIPFARIFILELAATPMYNIKAKQFNFVLKPGFRLIAMKYFYLRGYLHIPLHPSPSEKDLAFVAAPGVSFSVFKTSLQIFIELPLGISFRPHFLMGLMLGAEVRY